MFKSPDHVRCMFVENFCIRFSSLFLSCQFALRKKKMISKTTTITNDSSPHRKSDLGRVLFKTEFSMGNLLRTPNLSPPRI